jgi:two-component system, OmpR family, sensor histidine kinase SenX3
MKFFPERTAYSTLLVFVLTAVLIVLAVLQYRWSGQVSEAENEHMRSNLRTSMDQFRRQFHHELEELGSLARPNNSILDRRDWKSYAKSCSAIFRHSNSHWVRNVYLWIRDDSGTVRLLRLNREPAAFEETSWPSTLEIIRARQSRFFPASFRPEFSFPPFSWTLLSRIPLMVQPLMDNPTPPENPGFGMRWSGYVMIELNEETIFKQVFPELAQKIFQDPGGYRYYVAVVDEKKSGNLLFQSDPELTVQSFARYDEKMPLFEKRRERFDPMALRPETESQSGNRDRQPFRDKPRPPRSAADRQPPGPGNFSLPGIPMRPAPDFQGGPRLMSLIQFEDDNSEWQLIARHREGSLEAAVAQVRCRNLAISFGSLLLLAASMALIVVSARRAQRLARLQLDFVAGVSHELRTPLAVICSAGDNLAEGILETSRRSVKEYGQLILHEGRKLSGMVEQILQYTATHRRTRHINLREEDLNTLADSVLEQMQPVIDSSGFKVEKSLEPGLPPVRVDSEAVLRCIHNLIQNALKYSGESRWIGIRTMTVSAKHNMEVRLLVEDRGMGIAGNDLPHIFEPFYRGSAARDAQIHGTGLGLFLARDALLAMQGNLSVESIPGKGSTFTIHLPVVPGSDDHSNITAGKE